MNLSSPAGIFLGVACIYIAVTKEMTNTDIFFSSNGLFIVVGGTVAAALVCFSFRQLSDILFIILRELTGFSRKLRLKTIQEIVHLAEKTNDGEDIEDSLRTIKNDFLKESLGLYFQGSVENDELEEILCKRIQLQNEKYQKEGTTFKTIGKFPPAFGLIGATLGMIALLQGLGEPDAFDRLGPSMSVALTATFWGLVLANLFLVPLGENLSIAAEEDLIIRRIVVDGVMLLREEKHPLIVKEYLTSYLTPRQRNKIKRLKA